MAVALAIWIYAPNRMLVNVANDTKDAIFADPDDPLLPSEIYYGYAEGHQDAIAFGLHQIDGVWGLANRFRALIVAIAALVVAASLSVAFGTSSTPSPTHIVMEKGQP